MVNQIAALGIGGWETPSGFENCSIHLGNRGIVVVGTNGAGKSRLLSSIGRSVELIYDAPIGLGSGFWGLIEPSGDEQPWDFGAGGVSFGESRFHMSDPRLTYLEVVSVLRDMKRQAPALDPTLPEVVRERLQHVAELDEMAISTIAIIFATISVGQGIGDRDSAITTASHFPFLLACCMEIVENGRLGVSRLDDEPGGQWLRAWYNVHHENAPVTTEILATLEALEGRRVPIEDVGLRFIEEIPEIEEDLRQLANEPAHFLSRNRCAGPFEFHSKKIPNDAYALFDPVVREELAAPLPFEGQRLGNLDYLEPRYRRFYRKQREQFSARRVSVESVLSENPVYRWDEFILGLARVTLVVARTVYRLLMDDPPHLELVDIGGELKWQANGHGLELLSSAERRWARFSIQVASCFPDLLVELTNDESVRKWVAEEIEMGERGISRGLPGFLLVVDEPEMGLHRRAESRVTSGLLEISNVIGAKVVIATHSPVVIRELLSQGVDVVTLARGASGETTISSLSGVDLEVLAEVAGVDSSDMLQLARGFLLVEGEHDVQVLRSTVGSELDRVGVHVFPMRGASGASQVVDSSILWRFNSTKMFVLLDSVDNASVVDLWEEAKRLADLGSLDEALDLVLSLHEHVQGAKTEIKVIRDLMVVAIESPDRRRLVFLGLKKRDILDYFEVDSIVCPDLAPDWFRMLRNRSWKNMVKQWQREKAMNGVTAPFKTWLATTFPGTDLSASNLSRVSGTWDFIPSDFQSVLSTIIEQIDGKD